MDAQNKIKVRSPMSDKPRQVAKRISDEVFRGQMHPEDVKAIAAILAEEYPEQGWISVEERLPEKYNDVMIWKDGFHWPIAGWYSKSDKQWVNSDGHYARGITHWQPLPAPPARKGESHG